MAARDLRPKSRVVRASLDVTAPDQWRGDVTVECGVMATMIRPMARAPTKVGSLVRETAHANYTFGLCHDLGMSETFVVDVWSDVVCPFCYLGAAQLRAALDEFEHRDHVVVNHRAFELDRHAKLAYDRPLVDLVAAKYGMPESQVHAMHERLESSARALGMTWSLENARPTNSLDAHRVIAVASSQGRGESASERLFRAYFSEGELLSDHERLSALAREVGVEGVDSLWESDAFTDVVRADEAAADELGVAGVPSFLIDGKFMVSGAQGTEQILDVLRRAWARRAA
jgi:predicted DsbA family dithiol-disulfide isomerase